MRRRRLLIGLTCSGILLGLGWRAYTVADFYGRLRDAVTERGGVVRRGALEPGLLSSTVRDVRVSFGSEVVVSVDRLKIAHSPLGPISSRAEGTHVLLRGAPTAAWEHWERTSSLPVAFEKVSLDYRDASVGQLSTTDTQLTRRGTDTLVQAAELVWNGSSWRQISFSLSRPRTAIQVGLLESDTPVTLKCVPHPGMASEWVLDLPSQLLNPLAVRLGLGEVTTSPKSRVTGIGSLLVFNDAARRTRGQVQFVFDDWFRPEWPEAAALVGRSGSLSARLEPKADGSSFTLARVEVSAALFSMVGQGQLRLGQEPQLTLEAKGSLNCAQLATNLPASRYRDTVRSYLAPDREQEAVTLSLALQLTPHSGKAHEARWHLTAGCGLEELSSDASGSAGK